MVTDAIANFFISAFINVIPSGPVMDLKIPPEVLIGLNSLLSNLGYVFPIKQLLPILLTSTSVTLFKIVWAVVIRVKSFVPTMGA